MQYCLTVVSLIHIVLLLPERKTTMAKKPYLESALNHLDVKQTNEV